MAATTDNPFSSIVKEIEIGGETYKYFDLLELGKDKLARLPYSVRVLLESAVRNCDGFHVKEDDVSRILDWEKNRSAQAEIPFRPARVILQDFTGVPTVVDFAAMRDAVKRLGGDPDKINPICPTDLVIDHSVQVDVSRSTPTVMRDPGGRGRGGGGRGAWRGGDGKGSPSPRRGGGTAVKTTPWRRPEKARCRDKRSDVGSQGLAVEDLVPFGDHQGSLDSQGNRVGASQVSDRLGHAHLHKARSKSGGSNAQAKGANDEIPKGGNSTSDGANDETRKGATVDDSSKGAADDNAKGPMDSTSDDTYDDTSKSANNDAPKSANDDIPVGASSHDSTKGRTWTVDYPAKGATVDASSSKGTTRASIRDATTGGSHTTKGAMDNATKGAPDSTSSSLQPNSSKASKSASSFPPLSSPSSIHPSDFQQLSKDEKEGDGSQQETQQQPTPQSFNLRVSRTAAATQIPTDSSKPAAVPSSLASSGDSQSLAGSRTQRPKSGLTPDALASKPTTVSSDRTSFGDPQFPVGSRMQKPKSGSTSAKSEPTSAASASFQPSSSSSSTPLLRPSVVQPSRLQRQISSQSCTFSGRIPGSMPGRAPTSPCAMCPHSDFPVQNKQCPFHEKLTTRADALEQNQELEFSRNKERFLFCKWGAQALHNMLIVPPGSGIVHQVNLEYLARVVFSDNGVLYPDSLVGTDSHTTMINGLGVLGWGVGGIEAEAVMLGQAISMVLPEVVGYKITGNLHPLVTSTDVVLTITKHLRQVGVVGKFVEFFGSGVAALSIADRATISNMCPEYGATTGFFAVDKKSMEYLKQTGRDAARISLIERYLRANNLFRDYSDASQDPVFSEIVELDLSTVVPCCSGPKRPHDRVSVSDMKSDFHQCLNNKVGFKGYAIPQEKQDTTVPFVFDNQEYTLRHGSVVIAAITSCTNTSNPSVMLGAGLLAKNAVEAGLKVAPYVKTSLSPGSGVVTYYLRESGVTDYLERLGFNIVGYGCMTCIGNSGPLPEEVGEAIEKGDLVACGVLSGNRNFEGRIHPLTRANYLASPPLVIAYALAGTVDIDFETDPLGTNAEGKPVFLRDIWPSREQIQKVEKEFVVPAMFQDVYSRISKGNTRWNSLEAPESNLYPWDEKSTYIKSPPFFETMERDLPGIQPIKEAAVLLNLGDSVTTDHISPAGSIARNSSAARYLAGRGLVPREFNSYGSRRGHDEVMARGTFANIRLVNKFVSKPGPRTVYHPTGEEMDIFDAAQLYKQAGQTLIILAGKEYGSGSSRDWAAKGPWILGVRAVIAESYERIHRSNLAGMGVVPLQYLAGETADTLKLTGKEKFTLDLPSELTPGQLITVKVNDGRSFQTKLRFDTEVELTYFRHGGILNYMVRRML